MILPAGVHGMAGLALERMLYCLAAGSALTGVVAFGLRLLPRKNSRTRFAVWFSTLLAIVALPLLGAVWRSHVTSQPAPEALFTIPGTWAVVVVALWAALAAAGVLRVGIGLWRIQWLRRSCAAIDPQLLSPDLQQILADFRRTRPVSILASPYVDVPTAIGFRRPAVVIPVWLVEDVTAAELKYVVLHELAHLRRRDDWTNLIQKLVKAVLFFHPGVWWIERKLSLDREMACDDAVLLQTSSARLYAQCLARVAEKRLSRRHMALAQAAVDRVHQLSLRVMNILSATGADRTARLWKPAIPMVTAMALLCALSASQSPELVGVMDAPGATVRASSALPVSGAAHSAPALPAVRNTATTTKTPGAMTAGARTQQQLPAALFVPARYTLPSPQQRKLKLRHRPPAPLKASRERPPQMIAANFSPSPTDDSTASVSDLENSQVVLLFMTTQQVTAVGGVAPIWQIKSLEVVWFVPENRPAKQISKKI
jgi:beta-lactamase regulating signal transducer with metallopeptidase domain